MELQFQNCRGITSVLATRAILLCNSEGSVVYDPTSSDSGATTIRRGATSFPATLAKVNALPYGCHPSRSTLERFRKRSSAVSRGSAPMERARSRSAVVMTGESRRRVLRGLAAAR